MIVDPRAICEVEFSTCPHTIELSHSLGCVQTFANSMSKDESQPFAVFQPEPPLSIGHLISRGTFHKRVHGADPWTLASFRSSPRGVQVLADAQRRKPRQWIALDDDIEDWPESAQAHLIACDGSMGLSCSLVRDALHQKLLQFHSQGMDRA